MAAVTLLVLAAAAAGCWLLVTSVPGLRGSGLRARVQPFLHGLGGRPSRLLVKPSKVRSRWVAIWLARWGLVGSERLCRRLDAAGREADEIAYRVEQGIWAGVACCSILLVSVAGLLFGAAGPSLSLVVAAVIAGAGGALGRDRYLSHEVERRQEALREQLPTAIDHMTLALLAGGSIPTAFALIAKEAPPVVAAEFARVDADIRGGGTVIDALESFRARISDPAVTRFVDALCSAVERGASVSETLRAQADDVRDARRRYLLELGGRREILMLIPVVFFIMPVVVLFALYPGLVSLDLLVP